MDWKRKERNRKNRPVGQKAILYYLVALYIGYMGYSILHNRLSGDDTMSYPLAIAITSVFVIGAAWVVWYATRGLINDSKNSEIEITGKEEEQD
ncbi:MAG: hypothetical protein WCD89_03960 [Anaerocolumna sp.]